MGTIKVPKQSINLPIYHGTSEEHLPLAPGISTAHRFPWAASPLIR